MERGLGATIALIVCLVVQFAGVALYFFVDVPEISYRPIYWSGVAISGFAAVISSLLAERGHPAAIISGLIGAFLLLQSMHNLAPY
ncbi:MAG: hypothetical protein M0P64_00395 [Candidatus Pacebacteria bacterium]|jgi:hypothetical protein|nr:hypothetical protein [Candidatus Paceibacterota bacterium]